MLCIYLHAGQNLKLVMMHGVWKTLDKVQISYDTQSLNHAGKKVFNLVMIHEVWIFSPCLIRQKILLSPSRLDNNDITDETLKTQQKVHFLFFCQSKANEIHP